MSYNSESRRSEEQEQAQASVSSRTSDFETEIESIESEPISISTADNQQMNKEQEDFVSYVLGVLNLPADENNSIRRMFSFCFLNGFSQMFQKMVELINRYQNTIHKLDMKKNGINATQKFNLIQQLEMVIKIRQLQIQVQDFQFVSRMVFEYMSQKMLVEYSQRAPEMQVVNRMLPIRKLKCNNFDGYKASWLTVIKSLSLVKVQPALDQKVTADLKIQSSHSAVVKRAKNPRLSILNRFEQNCHINPQHRKAFEFSQQCYNVMVNFHSLTRIRHFLKSQINYYTRVINLAVLYMKKYNTRQMFNKRADIGHRTFQEQQATNMETNWNTFILTKLMGAVDETYLTKSFFSFQDSFEQYYKIMKSSGFAQMWALANRETFDLEVQVTEKSEIVKKRCQMQLEDSSDYSSVDSDDSYYEETEQIGMMPMSQEEQNNRKYSKMRDQNIHLKEQAFLDFKKLALFHQIQSRLISGKSLEQSFGFYVCFLQSLPSLKQEMTNLAKTQIKTIIENISIEVYERGTVIVNKGKACDKIYFVLWGTVNKLSVFMNSNENIQVMQANLWDNLVNLKKFSNSFVWEDIAPQSYVHSSSNITPDSNKQKKKQEFDLTRINQRQIQQIFNFEVDATLKTLQDVRIHKLGKFEPGDSIGSMEFSTLYNPSDFTAICKHDCVLLAIDKQAFKILHDKKIKKQKEFIGTFLKKKVPRFAKLYTVHKLQDTAFAIFNLCKYNKGIVLSKEGEKQQNMFIVLKGLVRLEKKISFTDMHGNPISKTITLVMAAEGDLVGEDSFCCSESDKDNQFKLKIMPSFYTATVVGQEGAQIFVTTALDFLRGFPSIISTFKQLCQTRRVFLQQIIDKQTKFMQSTLRQNQIQSFQMLKEAEVTSTINMTQMEVVKNSYMNQKCISEYKSIEQATCKKERSLQSIIKSHSIHGHIQMRNILSEGVLDKKAKAREVQKQNQIQIKKILGFVSDSKLETRSVLNKLYPDVSFRNSLSLIEGIADKQARGSIPRQKTAVNRSSLYFPLNTDQKIQFKSFEKRLAPRAQIQEPYGLTAGGPKTFITESRLVDDQSMKEVTSPEKEGQLEIDIVVVSDHSSSEVKYAQTVGRRDTDIDDRFKPFKNSTSNSSVTGSAVSNNQSGSDKRNEQIKRKSNRRLTKPVADAQVKKEQQYLDLFRGVLRSDQPKGRVKRSNKRNELLQSNKNETLPFKTDKEVESVKLENQNISKILMNQKKRLKSKGKQTVIFRSKIESVKDEESRFQGGSKPINNFVFDNIFVHTSNLDTKTKTSVKLSSLKSSQKFSLQPPVVQQPQTMVKSISTADQPQKKQLNEKEVFLQKGRDVLRRRIRFEDVVKRVRSSDSKPKLIRCPDEIEVQKIKGIRCIQKQTQTNDSGVEPAASPFANERIRSSVSIIQAKTDNNTFEGRIKIRDIIPQAQIEVINLSESKADEERQSQKETMTHRGEGDPQVQKDKFIHPPQIMRILKPNQDIRQSLGTINYPDNNSDSQISEKNQIGMHSKKQTPLEMSKTSISLTTKQTDFKIRPTTTAINQKRANRQMRPCFSRMAKPTVQRNNDGLLQIDQKQITTLIRSGSSSTKHMIVDAYQNNITRLDQGNKLISNSSSHPLLQSTTLLKSSNRSPSTQMCNQIFQGISQSSHEKLVAHLHKGDPNDPNSFHLVLMHQPVAKKSKPMTSQRSDAPYQNYGLSNGQRHRRLNSAKEIPEASQRQEVPKLIKGAADINLFNQEYNTSKLETWTVESRNQAVGGFKHNSVVLNNLSLPNHTLLQVNKPQPEPSESLHPFSNMNPTRGQLVINEEWME